MDSSLAPFGRFVASRAHAVQRAAGHNVTILLGIHHGVHDARKLFQRVRVLGAVILGVTIMGLP